MTDEIYDALTSCLFNNCEGWERESVAYFCDVKWGDLVSLVVRKVISGDSRSKYYAPTISEIIEFLSAHISSFSCHGKVIIKDGIPNVVIDGLYCADFIKKDREDFLKFVVTSDVIRDLEKPSILYNRW